jgi:hypothetical protein
MKRHLLLSTVAIALALGTVAASAQTRRPSDQNAPPSTQAQPPQGQMRANPPAAPAAQNQPNAPAQNAAPQAPAAPSATTGQAAPQPPQQTAPAANNQTQQPAAGQAQTQPPPQQGAAQQQQGQAQPGQAQPGMAQQPANAAGTANTGAAGANANANTNPAPQQNVNANQQGVITLSEQQNTRVSAAIRQANVRPLTNVSFSIAVGTSIPADVQLQPLPPALAEVVPAYRDYSLVVVEQEALIIDPNSRTIVAVVPFTAQQTTGANTAPAPVPAPAQAAAPPPPRERKKLDLTRDQREILRRQAERHHKSEKDKHVIIEERRSTTGAGPREPRVGDRVPDSAVIERRPVEVYRDEPPVREDRHPSARDIPLIGPLFGPRDED